jgi:hypothetical protein
MTTTLGVITHNCRCPNLSFDRCVFSDLSRCASSPDPAHSNQMKTHLQLSAMKATLLFSALASPIDSRLAERKEQEGSRLNSVANAGNSLLLTTELYLSKTQIMKTLSEQDRKNLFIQVQMNHSCFKFFF